MDGPFTCTAVKQVVCDLIRQGLPIAEPKVKNSRVKLVTSDREEEALQTGGVPSSFWRLTSDQGMPAPIISFVSKHSGKWHHGGVV